MSSGCWGASRAVLGGFRILCSPVVCGRVGVALRCVAWSAGVAIVASGAGSARAVDGTWVGAGSEWTTGSNWSSAPAVPDGTATFTNNGAPTAVMISNSTSIGTMEFTTAAPAYSFTVTNGASFAINTGVASTSLPLPNFAVNAGATLTAGDGANVTIGTLSNGASGGGTVVVGPTDPLAFLSISPATNTTFSGSFSGAGSIELSNTSSTLTLTGASNGGNIGTIGGDLTLCNCFGGGLTISGGSLTVNGFNQGVFVDGGTLSVVNGGRLQDNLDLLVSSTMVVSGPGSSATVAGFTGVRHFAPATITISNGGTLNSQIGAEIDGFFGTPSVTVTGAGSTWTVRAGLAVGGGSTTGAGTLTVANGGRVDVGGTVGVGDQTTGTSFMTVTGSGSTVSAGTRLLIGQTSVAIGTVTIADGGVVSAGVRTSIGAGSTLNLGTGGLSGALVTPLVVNDGAIVANFTDTLTVAANISGTGTLSKAGAGTLILSGTNSYSGGTTVTGGLINFAGGSLGTGTIAVNGAGLQWAAGNTSDISAQLAAIGSGGATFDTNGNNVSFATTLTGSGGLTKAGSGTLTLAGADLHRRHQRQRRHAAGRRGATSSPRPVPSRSRAAPPSTSQGFNQTIGSLAGAGAVTLGAASLTAGNDNTSTTFSGDDLGHRRPDQERHRHADAHRRQHLHRRHHRQCRHAGRERQPRQRRHGEQRRHAGRHRHASAALIANGGIIAPGQLDRHAERQRQLHRRTAATYQVEVNAAGQSDRINVAGTATINGGTVQVLAAVRQLRAQHDLHDPQRHRRRQRHLLGRHQQLRLPDAVARLRRQQRVPDPVPVESAFAAGAQTPNQYAVGTALDQVNATRHRRLRHRAGCAEPSSAPRRARRR